MCPGGRTLGEHASFTTQVTLELDLKEKIEMCKYV